MHHALGDFDWTDATRHFIPESEKIYSWWSYRAADWEASDRGRRLDHVWLSPGLKGALKSQTILKKMRGWQKASDHVPVIVVQKGNPKNITTLADFARPGLKIALGDANATALAAAVTANTQAPAPVTPPAA